MNWNWTRLSLITDNKIDAFSCSVLGLSLCNQKFWSTNCDLLIVKNGRIVNPLNWIALYRNSMFVYLHAGVVNFDLIFGRLIYIDLMLAK